MSFEEKIRQWVSVDNKVKQLSSELKELRGEKTALRSQIHTYAEEQELKHATIQISDGQLKFQSVRVVQPLTLKFVKECLGDVITDDNVVEQIMEHIKEKRDVKYVEDIKRFYK